MPHYSIWSRSGIFIFYPEEAINEGMCEDCYDDYLDDLEEDED